MNNIPASDQVIELMRDVLRSELKEVYVPEIQNRNGQLISENSLMVRITNFKKAFPDWVFYTRTCQQTCQKILGAKPASAATP